MFRVSRRMPARWVSAGMRQHRETGHCAAMVQRQGAPQAGHATFLVDEASPRPWRGFRRGTEP